MLELLKKARQQCWRAFFKPVVLEAVLQEDSNVARIRGMEVNILHLSCLVRKLRFKEEGDVVVLSVQQVYNVDSDLPIIKLIRNAGVNERRAVLLHGFVFG